MVGAAFMPRETIAQAAQDAPAVAEWRVPSTLHILSLAETRISFDGVGVTGGGLTRVGDEIVLTTGGGAMYRLDWAADADTLKSERLPITVPLNHRTFVSDLGPTVNADWFRVGDVLVLPANGGLRILASHHFWKGDDDCFVARVSMFESDSPDLNALAEAGLWRTVFESSPCLPIKERGNPFAGHHLGGRIARLTEDEILLTLGDHEFEGVGHEWDLVQDPASSYGKTILIHLAEGTHEIYTLGHRAPQGLFRDSLGLVWSTEHGPRGGDELNLIRRGRNYGWPLVTYGTQYGDVVWPRSASQGEHAGFEEPVFAWVPSIGISNLIRLEGGEFPLWRGDLLVGTLAAGSLMRIRLSGERAAYVEPIVIGRRIRDLAEGPDGRILLWTDEGSVLTLSKYEVDGNR